MGGLGEPELSMGLRPRLSADAAPRFHWNPRGWRPGMIYQKIVVPTAGGGFGEAVGAERGNSFPATRLRLVGLINLRMRCVCWLTTPSRFSPRS